MCFNLTKWTRGLLDVAVCCWQMHFSKPSKPLKKNCWERSWTYMMESCCLFTVLTKFLDWLFSSSLQSWVKRIESISLQSLKQRRMGTSPVKSFELFFRTFMFLTYRKRGMTSRWHKAKGIEAQTCEILLLRLFKSQDFAFCYTYVISRLRSSLSCKL